MVVFYILFFLALFLFLVYGVMLNYFPKVEPYEVISENVPEDFSIVLLADLHGFEHGRDNEKLLNRIADCEPDVVCIAGDLTVKNGKNTDKMLGFLRRLTEDYEVVYSPGNHEIRMDDYEEYVRKVKDMPLHYLENEMYEWREDVLFFGLSLSMEWYGKFWEKSRLTKSEIFDLLGDRNEGHYVVLLAHNPEYFDAYSDWGADLTLSGHVHGGIMRLPFLGGVIAPSLRLFPRYDAGMFERAGRRMIVSRGLGTHHIKLRFFNVPELSCIHIKKKTGEQNGGDRSWS